MGKHPLQKKYASPGTDRLSSGIPRIAHYEKLDNDADFRRLLAYSREFQSNIGSGDRSSRIYNARWVEDPFLQWSRRWEYVYVLQQLESWREQNPGNLDVADAGSGFTFFPFYLRRLYPDMRICCIDSDPVAGRAIQEAVNCLGDGPMFLLGDLEKLDQPSASLDAVFSVSVIEHTTNPGQVLTEIHRVLKPDGLFVCTFDISFESRSPMHVRRVDRLVKHLQQLFDPRDDRVTDPLDSTGRSGVVTTSWIARNYPERLPWRFPRLVWAYDALRGRFRTSLYRPLTFYCGSFVKKPRGDRRIPTTPYHNFRHPY